MTTVRTRQPEVPFEVGEAAVPRKPDGPFSAALIAAGIGIFALGLFTTMAEISEGFKELLNFYNPVGPLSGKTTYAVVLFLVVWVVLSRTYGKRDGTLPSAFLICLVLTGLGFVGTFPIFFTMFAAH